MCILSLVGFFIHDFAFGQDNLPIYHLVQSSEPEDISEPKKQQFLGLSLYWDDRMCRKDTIPSNCPGGETPVEETAGAQWLAGQTG